MPTPEVTSHAPSPRTRASCPLEVEAVQSQDGINAMTSLRAANEQIIHEIITKDASVLTQAGSAAPKEEDPAVESSMLSKPTTQGEAKSYFTKKDLGFALTAEGAVTISDTLNTSKRPWYPSSFLWPGSKFVGTQMDSKTYNVEVEIKDVDMRQSEICGYLKIDGLTDDFPSLTTFFDGEIIGPHFSFITKHPDWGASERSDLAQWGRFPAFRPLAKQAKNSDFQLKNVSQRENIFMRWKERFVVPDHKVNEIKGASYEGFYYICFNQVKGSITGVYFHAKSDRYQSLDLKHVPNRGCLAAFQWA